MNKTLVVPPELLTRVQEYVSAHGLELQVAESGPGAVSVQSGPEKQECQVETLFRGGWIPCRTAFGAAGRLGLPLHRMGELLDLLEIKVRACQLGCFP